MANYSSDSSSAVKAHLLVAFCCCYFFNFLISSTTAASGDPDAILVPISKDAGTLQYIAQLQQGTPPMPMPLVVDLGGPFSWVDCTQGYNSSTYGPAQCSNSPCASFGPDQTCGDCHSGLNPSPGCNNNTCSVVLANPITGETATGEVATDILTVASTDGSNPGPILTAHEEFVCGPTSTLLKGLAKKAMGVVGLGRTRSALLTQFDNEFSDEVFNFPLKFAICLTGSSSKSTGFAIFGKGKYKLLPGIDLSKSFKFTPMIQNLKGDRDTDYYLNVTAIKINGKELHLNKSIQGTKISTVNPYTVLETSIFNAVIGAFTKELINGTHRVVRPVGPFGACYESNGIESTRVGPAVPAIDLVLEKKSVYWRILGANSMVRVNEKVMCLGFVDGGENPRNSIVIGGYQLEDNLVQFDFASFQIGFTSSLLSKQTSCANFNFTSKA